ncbi:MAG: tetratricopeptide repeat protein [Candidatus Thermoplasmatota archaeon]
MFNLRWLFVRGKVIRHNAKGVQLFNEKRYEEARYEFEKAIALFFAHENSHYNLGNLLREIGDIEGAIKELNEAIKIKPDFIMAYSELASIYHKLGRKEEAEKMYRKAVEIDSKNPYVHINLGTLLRDKGAFSDAELEYRIALSCPGLDKKTEKEIRELIGV